MFRVILPAFCYPKKGLFWLFVFLIFYVFLLVPSVAAVTTTISNLPSVIGSDPFSLDVSLAGAADGTNYLRVDVYKEGTTKYFGETHNGITWYGGSDGKSYFPVAVTGSTAVANLQARLGNPAASEYDGTGQYRLRVRRYTVSGYYNSSEANAGSLAVVIDLSIPTVTAAPTPTPTPIPTVTPTPSPTATSNPTPTPASFPSGIYIYEFMPNPKEGEKEWVEVYNSNPFEAELNDWSIDDKEGGSTAQSFTKKVPGLGYHQVILTSNKLNNDGDMVRLLRPDLSVADSQSYASSQKGVSFMKNESGSWVETADQSPNESNRYSPVGGFPNKNSIPELKKLTLGSKVELEAFVSVPLDIFSEREFYVVDDFSGIKISVSEPPSLKAKLGDKIHIASTIEESYSEKYIKTSTYEILSTNQRFPDPTEIDTGEVGEDNEGKLVKVLGEYKESDGENFYIDDGSGEAKIYLKPATGIIKLKMEVRDEVEVQGVVSQYGFLKDGKVNYRVMPRFQSDLRNRSGEGRIKGTVLGSATQLPLTGGRGFDLPFLLIGLGLVLKTCARILT